ncbi:hypothetical protein GE09DRAFT_560369 [Coniochaeta sp. 2T2.1]|nr:hypothetical protein GE09DRAFT_560369 [Coniochaeta sp. 2T2.1]
MNCWIAVSTSSTPETPLTIVDSKNITLHTKQHSHGTSTKQPQRNKTGRVSLTNTCPAADHLSPPPPPRRFFPCSSLADIRAMLVDQVFEEQLLRRELLVAAIRRAIIVHLALRTRILSLDMVVAVLPTLEPKGTAVDNIKKRHITGFSSKCIFRCWRSSAGVPNFWPQPKCRHRIWDIAAAVPAHHPHWGLEPDLGMSLWNGANDVKSSPDLPIPAFDMSFLPLRLRIPGKQEDLTALDKCHICPEYFQSIGQSDSG